MPTNAETTNPIQELRAELAADPNLTDGERQAYLDNALDAEWAAFSQVQA